MKLHIFQGNTDSSYYETRLGHIICIEASSWREMLVEVFEKRSDMSEDWEEEKNYGIDWCEKPFVKLLTKGIDITRTEEGVRNLIREMSSDPTKELFCKNAVLSMNEEKDNIDPLLLVEETIATLPLLKYLEVIEEPKPVTKKKSKGKKN